MFASHAADCEADYGEVCDELRTHTSDWLHEARAEAVREQRRWRMRELAVTRVLDERGHIDDSIAQDDGVSIRSVRDTVATARALADLPEIAAAASVGRLSDDQLTQVVKVAGPSDDHRWAAEAPSWSPQDLAQRARTMRTPTNEEAAARRAARELRIWDRTDVGMTDGRFSLPDIDGVFVRQIFEHMADKMKPAKGEGWEPRPRRMADALVELCRSYADVHAVSAPAPLLIVEVPMEGPATIAGIPLPDAMVESLRAQARIEPVLVDGRSDPVAVGRVEPVLSDKTRRVVKQRDGKCRWPGCDHRVGLQVHHLWPRSWGGSDDLWNLASVCPPHHSRLAPHTSTLLIGNPNDPGGLVLVHRDDLPALAELAAEQARAGPAAA